MNRVQDMLRRSSKARSSRRKKVSIRQLPRNSANMQTDGLIVMDLIEEKGFLPNEFVQSETDWFYNSLGIDDMYFQTETVEAITNNILSLYAAKIAAFARDDKKLEVRLAKESSEHAVYIDTSIPGISVVDGPRFEQRIDEKYING